jgi:hypothetical protein
LVVAAVAVLAALVAFGYAQLGGSEEAVRTIALPEAEPPSADPKPADEPADEPSDTERDPSASVAGGGEAAPDGPAEPSESTVVRHDPEPVSGPDRSDPAPKKREPVRPARVEITFESEPSGAVVLFEGEQIGMTPFSLPIDRGRAMDVVFRKAGYRPQKRTFEAGPDDHVEARLVRAPRKVEPKPRPPPSKVDPTEKVSDLK